MANHTTYIARHGLTDWNLVPKVQGALQSKKD